MGTNYRVERTQLLVISNFKSVYENIKNKKSFMSRKHSVHSDENPKELLFEWYYKLYPKGDSEDCEEAFSLFLHIKSVKVSQLSVSASHYVRDKNDRIITSYQHNFSGSYIKENQIIGDSTFFGTKYVDTYDFGDKLTIEATVTFRFRHKCLPADADDLSDQINCSDMAAYLNKGVFSDVVISAGDQKYYAHKVLLSARSSVFAGIFAHDLKDSKDNVVTVEESPMVISEVLEYIYSNKLPTEETVSYELHAAADKYHLEELQEECESLLEGLICIEKVLKQYQSAHLHNAAQLKKKIKDFIKENFKEIIKSADWLSLMTTNVKLANEIINHVVN